MSPNLREAAKPARRRNTTIVAATIATVVIASACDPSVHPSEAQLEAFFESREWVIDGATVAELKDVRSNVIQEYGYGRYKKLVTQRIEENGVNANREKLIRFAVQHMASSDVGSSS